MKPSQSSDEFNSRMAAFAIAHISADANCLASSSALTRALALARCLPATLPGESADAPLPWWDRARAAVASLTLDERMLAGAGLRGGSIRAMEFVHDGVHMDLEVEPLVSHKSNRGIIRGQVESCGTHEGVPVVLVDEQGAQTASTVLDDLGFFSILMPAGTYAVAVALPSGAFIATGIFVQ